MEELRPRYFVGVDWASAEHAVCVVDYHGALSAQFMIAHTAEGLADLIRRLHRIAPRSEMAIAIERPSGLLVDTLVEAGFPVAPIHPNALKATRARFTASRGKSDPGDAYILADILRTDGHRFTALRPASDQTKAIRALVRTRDDLVATRVQLANQLRSLLEGFWPGAVAIFADIDSPIALAFIDTCPTPQSALRLGEKRLQRFLHRHAYCGRRPAAILLERLRSAPASTTGELDLIAAQLQQHPDAAIIQSFPRTGSVNAAQILAELGDDRQRFSTYEQLAAEAGVAPVTHASGKHHAVVCRFACNKRLRQALTTWADNSRHAQPWAAAVYRAARARGCDHPHAVRILARSWTRVLWRCWHNGTLYNATQHGRALPFLNQAVPAAEAA